MLRMRMIQVYVSEKLITHREGEVMQEGGCNS